MFIHLMDENLSNFTTLLQPSRPFFCTTINQDGSDHIAPFSWLNPISCKPPRVAFAIQNKKGNKESVTLRNIHRTGEFVVNLPHQGQEYELVQSALITNHNKFLASGFTRLNATFVSSAIISECNAAIECKVLEIKTNYGDHDLVIADVISVRYLREMYDINGYPIPEKTKPLIHCTEQYSEDRQLHTFIDTTNSYSLSIEYKDL